MSASVIVLNGFCEALEKKEAQIGSLFDGAVPQDLFEEEILICKKECSREQIKKLHGKKIRLITCEAYWPEQVLPVLSRLLGGRELVVFGSGFAGEELAVRLGVRMNAVSLSGVTKVWHEQSCLYAEKKAYADHMNAVYRLEKGPYFLAASSSLAQRELTKDDDGIQEIEEIQLEGVPEGYRLEKAVCENTLEETPFLLAAGRGMGSKEQIDKLRECAKKIGAEFGVTRPVAMSAWAPMEELIGVSGTLTHPKICIAVGCSGAPAFYAGIEKSAFIAAVNSDKNAPLMKKADAAVEASGAAFIEALEKYAAEKRQILSD